MSHNPESKSFRKAVTVFFILASLAMAAALSAAPLGEPGTVAAYVTEADLTKRVEEEKKNQSTVLKMEMQLGPVETHNGKEFQWFGIYWRRENRQEYQAWILLDRWPTQQKVATGKAWPVYKNPPEVKRYLWKEHDWESPIEFVHEVTGETLLPPMSIWLYTWPQEIGVPPRGGRPVSEMHERVQFIGWPYRRDRIEMRPGIAPPREVRIKKLNPDLIIGSISGYQDQEGRHKDILGIEHYDFQVTTEEDARKDMEAGVNLREMGHYEEFDSWEWPLWHKAMFTGAHDYPAILFRANYAGRTNYLDEPGIHHRGTMDRLSEEQARAMTLEDAASRLISESRSKIWKTRNNYSAIWWNASVDRIYSRGNIEFVDPPFPAWEAIWQDAWYELRPDNGVSGIVNEDLYADGQVNNYNRAFGSRIPPTIENACRIHIAVMRGAARNFGKKWGAAYYCYYPQMLKPQTDMTAFKILYDAGATWFWNWRGWPDMSTASVPYSYKRYMTSWVRQCFEENPNRDMDALLHAAKVAIAMPYGYTFTYNSIQGTKWFPLDRKNQAGVPYRQVLANVALEAERLIRSGVDFDLVVEEPRFRKEGYDEIIYCREDGSVVVERPGQGEETFQQARPVERPDLGPPPTLEVELVETPSRVPGQVVLKAKALEGTGELALDPDFMYDAGRSIGAEVLAPGDILLKELSVEAFDAGGLEIKGDRHNATIRFKADREGPYRVRVSVADCFGKTAVEYVDFELKDEREDISAFPEKWMFRVDPDEVGQSQEWFARDLEESGWQPIAVPAWWEKQGVEHDGIAWYRVWFSVPAKAANRRAQLDFQGVDEEAWVYVNGQKVGERTEKSTGKSYAQFWDHPFQIELAPGLLIPGQDNLLVVRCKDNERAGGIFEPVKLRLLK